MAYGKFAKRAFKAGRRYAKKRYVRKGAGYGSGVRFNKVIRDVALIKSKLNTEKKSIDSTLIDGTFIGQSDANIDSSWAVDFTPRPASGSGYDERTGRSIKAVAMSLQYQVYQMPSCAHPMKIEFYLLRVMGAPQNVQTVYNQFKLENPITTVRDMMSNRDIDYFQDYRILKKFVCYLPQDGTSGTRVIKTGQINMKLNHHIQFSGDTTGVTEGQVVLLAYADSGNSSSTASTLPNVVVPAANSGAGIQTYCKWWYVDN